MYFIGCFWDLHLKSQISDLKSKISDFTFTFQISDFRFQTSAGGRGSCNGALLLPLHLIVKEFDCERKISSALLMWKYFPFAMAEFGAIFELTISGSHTS